MRIRRKEVIEFSKIQELKNLYSGAFIEDFGGCEIVSVDKRDLDWLIEQAEIVERCGKVLKEIAEESGTPYATLATEALSQMDEEYQEMYERVKKDGEDARRRIYEKSNKFEKRQQEREKHFKFLK